MTTSMMEAKMVQIVRESDGAVLCVDKAGVADWNRGLPIRMTLSVATLMLLQATVPARVEKVA